MNKTGAARINVNLTTRRQVYDIVISVGMLLHLGREARGCLPANSRRVVIVSNPKVFKLYGEGVASALRACKFRVAPFLVKDGERFKTIQTLESCLRFLADYGLERSDAVASLGGGVVGDLAGLASALYLRGVAFLQCPTTLLAQIDASVGGKTAVNLPNGKNLVGAFKQPNLVVVDPEVLGTLPRRELTAGWCEAVKQAVVGGRRLFIDTYKFLGDQSSTGRLDVYDPALAEIIKAHCAFKSRVIIGDPFEQIDRTDSHSRQILNFGHTIGHALETITEYRRFRHGEAVGYGMIVAGEVSNGLGLLEASELEFLKEAVRLCGRLPAAADVDPTALISACRRDKKSVGGRIRWVLLERIGRAVLVDGRKVPTSLLRESIRATIRSTAYN